MSRIEWKLFLVVWLFLSLSVSQFGPRHSSMIQSILRLTSSLVDHQEITLDREIVPVVGALTPGEVRALPHQDPRRPRLSDLAHHADHYYSGMPPGLSWALIPIYLVTKPIGLIFSQMAGGIGDLTVWETKRLVLAIAAVPLLVAPLTATGAVLMLRMLAMMGLSVSAALWGAVALVWASLFVLYGTFVSHNAVGALLVFTSFYLLFTARHGPVAAGRAGETRFLASGLLAGLAVVTEYAEALPVAVLLVYCMVGLGRRSATAFALGAGMVGAVHAWYGQVAFGSIFDTPYQHRFAFLAEPRGFAHLLYPRPAAFLTLTFGPTLGFFLFMPWSLASLGACASAIRSRTRFSLEAWCIVSIGALMLLYNSSIDPEVAPYGFGPRFLMVSIPFMALALGLKKECLDRKIVRGAVVAGILLNGLTLASGRSMNLCERVSAHACQLEAILAHGPRTHIMRVFSDNIHSLGRLENLLIFSLWTICVVLLCMGAVRLVDRRFERSARRA